jgi:hypothetical protein
MSGAALIELIERRRRRRFCAAEDGVERFRLLVDGEPLPVLDLSADGFSMPAATPPMAHRAFHFILQCDGRAGEVCGTARIINYQSAPAGGKAGCVFEAVDGDGLAVLGHWLAMAVPAEPAPPPGGRNAGAPSPAPAPR